MKKEMKMNGFADVSMMEMEGINGGSLEDILVGASAGFGVAACIPGPHQVAAGIAGVVAGLGAYVCSKNGW